MNEGKSKVSILVSSCDRYQETWMPFFTLLSKYWRDCKYPKYLLTESKQYNLNGVSTINCNDNHWSNRLRYALNQLDTEYILFMLDDFFIMGKVDENKLSRYISYMDADSRISAIYLKTSTGQSKTSTFDKDLIEMEPGKKYFINFQAGLWRRKDMVNMIKPNLSPWDIEENPDSTASYKLYCVKGSSYIDCSNDVIPYLWAIEAGYGICKSKWLWNNAKFFKREGIDCKFTSLPTMSRASYLYHKYLEYIKILF